MYGDRGPDGKYLSNQLDSGAVIDCLDWRTSRTPEELQADAALFKERAPVLGPYLAYTGLSCGFINPAGSAPKKISALDTARIIIVGTLRDPATPYEWAVGLHKIFTNSVLITLDADGHTGEGRGSSCVDNAVAIYFLRGKTPDTNISCTL